MLIVYCFYYMDVISIVNGLESFFFDLCLLGLELVSKKSCSGSFFLFG